MKNIYSITLIALFAAMPSLGLAQDSKIFDAMQDELKRSMSTVKKDGFAKPYFMSYTVYDTNAFQTMAQMGSVTSAITIQYMDTDIMLRVGSYKEDNSNFENSVYSYSEIQSPAKGYDALRFALWAATDQAYKDVLAQLAKKEAFKKSNNVVDQFDDFSNANVTQIIEPANTPSIDQDYWKKVAAQTSAQGDIEALDEFSTSITINNRPTYFLTSESAKYFKDETLIRIVFTATAKTKNGFEIKETKTLSYSDIKDVPSQADLVTEAAKLAKQTAALSEAEKVSPYIGPVLLEKGAAASLFNNIFRKNIINTKPILSASNKKDDTAGEFAQKKGLKIMPVNFNVIDDPLLKSFGGKKLAGYYAMDIEGVPAKKLQLVKSGILTDLPTTRSLIKDQKRSNGHARVPYANRNFFARAGVGNLMFLPHSTVPEPDFKNQFMKYCKEEGLEYCYIIRGSLNEDLLSVYRMNATTGEETPFYGAAKPTLTTRTLRDIKFASDDLEAYNYLALSDYGYSIISPSVILSELELNPTQKSPSRKPLLKKPN